MSPSFTEGPIGTSRFGNPTGVSMDSAGNVYVTEHTIQHHWQADAIGTNWLVSTIAGQVSVKPGTNDVLGTQRHS